jgi:glycosyltransferase involved in cell wall biosynthesis
MTTLEFPPDTGGVGESVKRISTMLRQAGHEMHVFVFHSSRCKKEVFGGPVSVDTSEQDGIVIHRYQHVDRGNKQSEQDVVSDAFLELQKLHNQENFDLFHAFFLNETGFLTTLLAREVGRPVVNSIRGADIHKNVFNPKTYSQSMWAMENSSWLTFVSRELERRAHILVPSTQGRTSSFWNSIVPLDFEALDKPQLNGRIRGTVIGTSGNFRHKKGIEFLIQACAELSTDTELTLLMVGDFVAKEKDYWNDLLRRSGIADRTIVTGRLSRDQALAYHHIVDIFTIPSLRDGCPNAMMEAMLAQKAVVGTNVDAIGEILCDREDGLVVRPGSTEDLAFALRELVENPDLRARLGAAARQKAMRDLAPAHERDNWLNVYDRVVAANDPVYLNATAISG